MWHFLRYSECLCVALAVLVASQRGPTTVFAAVSSPGGQETNIHKRRRAIVGGRVADPGRYPYFVRLDYDGRVGCGGTLVAADLVLTAAHCVYDENVDISTIVAVSDTETDTEERIISRVFPHPAYDDSSNRYDVAVIQVNEPFKNASLVQLVTTTHSKWALQKQPDTNVTVLGWGVTAEESDVSDVLREANLRVVSDDECQDGYSDGSIHSPSMMCAATETNQGPCYRDSGGPLLLLGETDDYESDLQVGIVSFGGDFCADPTVASVYVDVANVQTWVYHVVRSVDSLVDSMTDDDPIIVVTLDAETDDEIAYDTVSSSARNRFGNQRWLRVGYMLIVLACSTALSGVSITSPLLLF